MPGMADRSFGRCSRGYAKGIYRPEWRPRVPVAVLLILRVGDDPAGAPKSHLRFPGVIWNGIPGAAATASVPTSGWLVALSVRIAIMERRLRIRAAIAKYFMLRPVRCASPRALVPLGSHVVFVLLVVMIMQAAIFSR
jgi:hypothetical protein